MKLSVIVNNCHSFLIIYLLFGWLLESQRDILVFILPTIQYQFLVNNNQCILTQLEKRLLMDEKKDKKKDKKDIEYDSFVDKKLKEYNIPIADKYRELIIHSFIYGSFLISYFL